MDKFEQMMKDVKGTSPAELNKDMEKYKGMCQCMMCPTHTTCAKDAKERVFCLVGKSFMCISEQKACICPTCPLTGVWPEAFLLLYEGCGESPAL